MTQGRNMRITGATILIISTINVLISIDTCLGAPSAYDPRLEIKPSWQDNSLTPIIPEPCLTGGCWEWLGPISITRGNAEILQDQTNDARLEDRPQMDEGETNAQTDGWKAGSGIFMPRTKPSSSIIRQMSQRPVKKDSFTSRSWGPGGLPFSVLYMNSHGARSNNNRPTTAPEVAPTRGVPESAVRRNDEGAPAATTSSTRHPNNRAAVKNGSNSQPRRQYSIIPQFFISYGWGPLGK